MRDVDLPVCHFVARRTLARAAIVSDHCRDILPACRSLIDVGGMEGDLAALISTRFPNLDAVRVVEGREMHRALGRFKYPRIEFVDGDAARLSDADLAVDVVVVCGLIYHLTPSDAARLLMAISRAARKIVVIDTEIVDYEKACYITRQDGGMYISGICPGDTGCVIASAAWVEAAFDPNVWALQRFDSEILNSIDNRGGGIYDWKVTDSGAHEGGQRRFWIGIRR